MNPSKKKTVNCKIDALKGWKFKKLRVTPTIKPK